MSSPGALSIRGAGRGVSLVGGQSDQISVGGGAGFGVDYSLDGANHNSFHYRIDDADAVPGRYAGIYCRAERRDGGSRQQHGRGCSDQVGHQRIPRKSL